MDRIEALTRRHLHAWAVGLCIIALPTMAWATNNLIALREQIAAPQEAVNYASAKLAIDQLIDPGTDSAFVHRELARWEQAVRSQTPDGANARQTLDALLKTLYISGAWNQGQPFTYDLTDPLGKNPKNKLLATYLISRKGNCVSMPILVVILGQRLGLPVALATAPNHVLVKFADDTQRVWMNVEATAGGFKFDSSYERETGITPTAIRNELYLRPLSPREGVGVIASTLMEHYGAEKEGEALEAVTDLALTANPKDPVALVWKANAYYLQLNERYVRRYPDAAGIPVTALPDYQRLSRENLAWFAKAEQLGWIPTTPEQTTTYLPSIRREQTRKRP